MYIFICCCQHIITRYDLLLVSFAFSRIKPLPSFFLDGALGGWTRCWGLLTSTNLLKTFCCHDPAFAVVLSTVFLLKLKVNTALFCLINMQENSVCDLWMKEWRARPKNKGRNQREAAVMMMGLYDVKVLMGISAAGLKEQSRCMCVCVPVVCVCMRKSET